MIPGRTSSIPMGLRSALVSLTPREIRIEAHKEFEFPLISLQRSNMIMIILGLPRRRVLHWRRGVRGAKQIKILPKIRPTLIFARSRFKCGLIGLMTTIENVLRSRHCQLTRDRRNLEEIPEDDKMTAKSGWRGGLHATRPCGTAWPDSEGSHEDSHWL